MQRWQSEWYCVQTLLCGKANQCAYISVIHSGLQIAACTSRFALVAHDAAAHFDCKLTQTADLCLNFRCRVCPKAKLALQLRSSKGQNRLKRSSSQNGFATACITLLPVSSERAIGNWAKFQRAAAYLLCKGAAWLQASPAMVA
jgi:hypothetical protein